MFELVVDVIAAEDIIASDKGGTSDPFAVVAVQGSGGWTSRHTSVVKKTLNPEWNERLVFEVTDLFEPLVVKLFDKDLFGGNDFLGQASVAVEAVTMDAPLQCWVPLEPDAAAQAVTGRLNLRLSMRAKQRHETSVAVRVIAARGLKAVDRGGTSDPYATVALRSRAQRPAGDSKARRLSWFASDGKATQQQTKVVKKTLAPVWDEAFSLCAVADDELIVQVYDRNTFGRDVFLGEVVVDLANLDTGPAIDGWVALQGQTDSVVSGELHLVVRTDVRLAEPVLVRDWRLELVIHGARGLLAADRGASSDPFVVVSFPGAPLQETTVQYKTLQPSWNESFAIAVPRRISEAGGSTRPSEQGDADSRELLLEVFDYDMVGSNDFLGEIKIRIGSLEVGAAVQEWMPLQEREGKQVGVTGELYVGVVLSEAP